MTRRELKYWVPFPPQPRCLLSSHHLRRGLLLVHPVMDICRHHILPLYNEIRAGTGVDTEAVQVLPRVLVMQGDQAVVQILDGPQTLPHALGPECILPADHGLLPALSRCVNPAETDDQNSDLAPLLLLDSSSHPWDSTALGGVISLPLHQVFLRPGWEESRRHCGHGVPRNAQFRTPMMERLKTEI